MPAEGFQLAFRPLADARQAHDPSVRYGTTQLMPMADKTEATCDRREIGAFEVEPGALGESCGGSFFAKEARAQNMLLSAIMAFVMSEGAALAARGRAPKPVGPAGNRGRIGTVNSAFGSIQGDWNGLRDGWHGLDAWYGRRCRFDDRGDPWLEHRGPRQVPAFARLTACQHGSPLPGTFE